MKAGDSKNTSTAYAAYFLALTHHHLHHAAESRTWLAKANALAKQELTNKSPPPPWNRRLTLELFRKEAENLIGPVDPSKTDTEKPPSPAIAERVKNQSEE